MHPATPSTSVGRNRWRTFSRSSTTRSFGRLTSKNTAVRHGLASYQKYYNEVRTHLSLQKDAPVRRDVCRTGRVRSSPILGGLNHQYVRV
jgi:hypothetical protein